MLNVHQLHTSTVDNGKKLPRKQKLIIGCGQLNKGLEQLPEVNQSYDTD